MNIQHIIMATDLSPSARAAYPHAAGIAKMFNARITLLHVNDFDEFTLARLQLNEAFQTKVNTMREALIQEHLQQFKNWDIPVEVEVMDGDVTEVVLAACALKNADLLVIAKSQEESGVGSSAENLLANSRIPTLLIPTRKDQEPASEPIQYTRIIAPTDFSTDSEKGLALTFKLAEIMNTSIFVPHILRRPFFAYLQLSPESLEHIKVACEENLQTQLAKIGHIDAEQAVILGEKPAESIAALVKGDGGELIVIPTHGKNAKRDLIGHTTRTLASRAQVPVLVLPREYLATVV